MKSVTFETSGKGLKMAEEDSYENGVLPGAFMSDYDIKFSAPDLPALIAKITEHFEAKTEDVLLDSCDEKGRIDINVMENAKGEIVDSRMNVWAEWKEGRAKLWACTYTFNVERVERETVSLK